MKPAYNITLDGKAITFNGRLISLTLNDKNGFAADELSIEVSDHDGLIELPKKGVKLVVEFGFALTNNQQMSNKGEYIVDEVEHRGPPDVVAIRAHAANFRDSLLEQREQSYDNKTLGDILQTIAGRNKLKPAIAEKFKSIKIKHLDQNNESDANLLTRLAKDYGAVGTIKNDNLLFIEKGKGKSASGEDLPVAVITRNMGDQHSYRESDRAERVTGVKAFYHNTKKGKRKHVIVGNKGYCRNLKRTYANKQEATKAAEAEMKRLQHIAKTLQLNLAIGRPELFAEMPVQAVGFKPEIDKQKWFATEITHSLNDSGYTCSVNCEAMQE